MAEGTAGSFGALLRWFRLAANLTQEELAERAGVSVRGLKYLEQGARHPFPDTIRRLAAALALPPEQRAALVAAAQAPAPDPQPNFNATVPAQAIAPPHQAAPAAAGGAGARTGAAGASPGE